MVRDHLEPVLSLAAKMARKFPHSSKGGHGSQNSSLSPSTKSLAHFTREVDVGQSNGIGATENTPREGDAPSPTYPRG